MTRYLTSLPFVVASVISIGVTTPSDFACAKETNDHPVANVGFLASVPAALKKRFPMCDEFLNVTWVDSGKAIGYARYEIYTQGSKVGPWLSLIHLDKTHPRFDYSLREYEENGRLDGVYEAIRSGNVSFPASLLTIEQKLATGSTLV